MFDRDTTIRSLHDIGLSAWFGGSLMGAIGLNGAAAEAHDPSERLRLSADGWARWTPWQIGAIAAHAIGGTGLILANRSRLKHQPGATLNTVVKAAVTVAAAGASAYAGYLGAQIKLHQHETTAGVTEPAAGTSEALSASQRQLKIIQWAIPALTGTAVVLAAQQGEQQREAVTWLDKIRG